MIATKDIAWLAGLLEGEGCFQNYGSPRISLTMTDRDVVERAARMLKPVSIRALKPEAEHHKIPFRIAVTGARAAGWMMTLYPLMGARRQKKIEEVLDAWRVSPGKAWRKGQRGARNNDQPVAAPQAA